jgi:hypothetical protein
MDLLYALVAAGLIVWVFWPRKDVDDEDPRIW